jgi:hypothetical protein
MPSAHAPGPRRRSLSVRVRPLSRAELALLEELLPSSDYDIHARRLAMQESGGSTYYIAWLGDRPVGHTLVRWRASSSTALTIWLPMPRDW